MFTSEESKLPRSVVNGMIVEQLKTTSDPERTTGVEQEKVSNTEGEKSLARNVEFLEISNGKPQKEHVDWSKVEKSVKNAPESDDSSLSDDSDLPPAPDGGWGWVIVLSSFVAHLVADGTAFAFGILYMEILRKFQEGSGKTAFIGSLYVSVPLLFGPLASPIVEEYGCRKAIICGALLTATGFILSVFAPNIEVLCITLGLVAGIGLSPIYIAAIVAVAFYFEKRRSLATGLATCGSGIGCFIFAPLLELLLDSYGFRGTLLLIAGIYLNLCVAGALMRPLEWEDDDSDCDSSTDSSSGSSTPSQIPSPPGSPKYASSVKKLNFDIRNELNLGVRINDDRTHMKILTGDVVVPCLTDHSALQTELLDDYSVSMVELPISHRDMASVINRRISSVDAENLNRISDQQNDSDNEVGNREQLGEKSLKGTEGLKMPQPKNLFADFENNSDKPINVLENPLADILLVPNEKAQLTPKFDSGEDACSVGTDEEVKDLFYSHDKSASSANTFIMEQQKQNDRLSWGNILHIKSCSQLDSCKCDKSGFARYPSVGETWSSVPTLDTTHQITSSSFENVAGQVENEEMDPVSASMPHIMLDKHSDTTAGRKIQTGLARKRSQHRNHHCHHRHHSQHHHQRYANGQAQKLDLNKPSIGRVANIWRPPASMITFHTISRHRSQSTHVRPTSTGQHAGKIYRIVPNL